MTLEEHLDVAARWAVRLAFEAWAEEAWEHWMPDFGEYDVDRILEATEKILPPEVSAEQWTDTYDWFTSRAEKIHE